MAVGLRQVQLAVVIGVQCHQTESEDDPAHCGQTSLGGSVGEEATAMIVINRGGFAVKIRHGQVNPAIAVKIPAGDAHARKVSSTRVRGQTEFHSSLDEPKTALVVKHVIGRGVVGDKQIGLAVAIEVGRQDAQAAASRVRDAGLLREIDEVAVIIAKNMVRKRLEKTRVAIARSLPIRAGADCGCLRVPFQVMAYVKIEIAVAVQVGPGRRGGPVAIPGQPGAAVQSSNRPLPRLW